MLLAGVRKRRAIPYLSRSGPGHMTKANSQPAVPTPVLRMLRAAHVQTKPPAPQKLMCIPTKHKPQTALPYFDDPRDLFLGSYPCRLTCQARTVSSSALALRPARVVGVSRVWSNTWQGRSYVASFCGPTLDADKKAAMMAQICPTQSA